jgi:hypothetical protein
MLASHPNNEISVSVHYCSFASVVETFASFQLLAFSNFVSLSVHSVFLVLLCYRVSLFKTSHAAGHLPISLWVYESDDIVAKYQKLDVPPPFGKFTDFKSNPNAHIKPFFKGYSS